MVHNLTDKNDYIICIKGILISLAGITLISFDTVLIRLAASAAWDVAFWRGLLIAVTTSIILYIREKTTLYSKIKSDRLPLVLSGIMWGLSGLFFVIAVTMTIAANVLVLLSMSPLAAGVAGYFLLGEKIQKSTVITIIIAAAGIIIIFSADIAGGSITGNLIGLMIPVILGTNLAFMRKYRTISRTAAVIIGGIVTAFISSFFASPFSLPRESYIYLVLLGLFAVPFGQVLLATATRYIFAYQVALIMMLETVLGPFWVWAVIGEIPPPRTFAGGVLILGGVLINSIVAVYAGRGLFKKNKKQQINPDLPFNS